MDIGGVSSSSVSPGNIGEPSTAPDEDGRVNFEVSELDKLLGLPPPRFDLGSADIDSFKVLDSANSGCNFDADIDFAVPQKPGLPERLKMESGRGHESETEICYNKELTKVSVIKTELNIESDGQEVESECNSYLPEPVPELPSPSARGDMLYKRGVGRGRGSRGSLSRVVSRLHAKGEPLHTILSPNSVCDIPVPKNPPTTTTTTTTTIIPSPVINKLKKLGTSVEVETPSPVSLHTINGQISIVPEIPTSTNPSTPTSSDSIPTGFLEIMQTLDKAVGLTSDLTKKKKKRIQKKTVNQVPSTLQLIAEIENSANLTKFSFQVDAKQVIELYNGQKLYSCDICSGVYHRGFSLKRHYLKTHINYKHVSKRDLHNCGILLDPSIEKGGARKKQLIKEDSPPVVTNLSPPSDIPDLYRCHNCYRCFMLISDLQAHLMEHLPVSVENMADKQFNSYTCPKCKARYQKKKLYLRHKEICGTVPVEPEPVNTHFCLFCDKTFSTFVQKKLHHLQMHHPKKRLHQCYLCKTKMFKERIGVLKHLILHHPDEYIGCLPCKLRFATREDFKKHNKENHKPIGVNKKIIIEQKLSAKKEDVVNVVEHSSEIEKPVIPVISNMTNGNSDLHYKCTECPKMFASHLNMTRHHRLAHSVHPRTKKKKVVQKKHLIPSRNTKEGNENTTPAASSVSLPNTLVSSPLPPTDPEILFYSTISHNIRENLTHHLDGKLDSQEIMEYDLNKTSELRNKVLNFSASFTSESAPPQPEASSMPLQHRESRPTPISPRGHWEKFSFPKNYDGRCGLSSYIKDMSHLDISTQLTMRRNLQRLNSTAGPESSKESPANIPAGLLLVEKPGPDCAETFGEPETSKDKGTEATVLSGEWVRPRTYLCAACGYKSTNLWDVEDHKYALHPNVWVPHVEIVGEQSSAWDWFYHRRLPPDTVIEETTPDPPALPPPCSKCNRPSPSLADLHRHMLDCGGDTTWAATMLGVTSPGARRRKWRPFGSRRRKQTGRRGLRRNIPNTPAKHSCGRIRTKPGDMDTIQKMIANLPPKRATRRVVGDDVDIKTRSQATISSNSIPISSVATHSSLGRSNNMKSIKLGKSSPKLNSHKKNHSEEQSRKKDNLNIKEEPTAEVLVKEERVEDRFPLEAENTIQHSDILTSLQMIRVVRTNPVVAQEEKAPIEEPIETSKIIAAMREAMSRAQERAEAAPVPKTAEKKKKKLPKCEDKSKKIVIKEEEECKKPVTTDSKKTEASEGGVIICNGCGMQFDNQSACQRHKKKCVYWKEEKSNEEDNKNRCSHCGSTFPYLMALLKHNCSTVDLTEEPPMPELCPVKPVEEVQCDSVEEIPILSPVYVAPKDDNAVSVRRILLLEDTIKQVGEQSYDLSSYFVKYFNSPKECQDNQKAVSDISKAIKTEEDSSVNCKKVDLSTQTEPEHIVEEPSKLMTVTSAQQDLCIDMSNLEKANVKDKVKSPNNKQILKTKKVSDIFKEMKKRGRRRPGLKVKTAPKILSTKLGLLKSVSGTQSVNAKKKQMIAKKKRKRSSNFVMLMKEWDKLEKEGAVAMGKRQRHLTRNDINVAQGRSRRRFASSYTRGDFVDTDSIFTDNSSLYEHVQNRRRSKRANSFGSLCDFPLIIKEESDVEITEKIENDLMNNVSTKDQPPLVKRKPGRPRVRNIVPNYNVSIKQEVIENDGQNKNASIDQIVIKTENDNSNKADNHLQEDTPVQKRKPGRPPRVISLIKGAADNPKQDLLPQKRPGRPRTLSTKGELAENSIHEEVRKLGRPQALSTSEETANNHTGEEVIIKKRKPGRPRSSIAIEETADSPIQEELKRGPGRPRMVSASEEIADSSVQGDLSVHQRKPGRPRGPSITDKTEKHILETIELIVRGPTEPKNSEKQVVTVENVFNAEKNLVNQQQTILTQHCSSTIKTEDLVDQTIEDIVKGSNDHILNEEDMKWFNVDEVIYRVSISSDDIFVNQNSETPICNTLDDITKRKPGRPRKMNNSNTSTPNPDDSLSMSKGECNISEVCKIQGPSEGLTRVSSEVECQPRNVQKHFLKMECEEMKNTPSYTSSLQMFKGKRKSTPTSYVNDANESSQPKKIKTKQMLIADYLNICNNSKKSSLDNGIVIDEKLVRNNEPTSQNISINSNSKESASSPAMSAEASTSQSNTNEKSTKSIKDKKHKTHKNHIVIDNPLSPSSSSSKEDMALSIIREKVIKKRKKKMQLKKLIKNKRLDIIDSKLNKLIKPKLIPRDDRLVTKEKLGKKKKVLKVGVSRNHWEVSIVDNKNKPVKIFCDAGKKSAQSTTDVPTTETPRRFYCSYCDTKFESSYNLYEHQQTPDHKLKSSAGDQQKDVTDDSDPLNYCKSIGNIINDLEKRTLNVAKVMHHLKQRDPAETASTSEATSDLAEPKSSGVKEPKTAEEGWQPEWPMKQEWPSRSATPLGEGAYQSWEVDSFSTGCSSSIGSIMDTVNKLLSSDQDQVSAPAMSGYSWADLQQAMGASDEEMAMLEQLGEHSLQEEYVYDNTRPLVDWPTSEDSPTLTDLDHPEQSSSPSPSQQPTTSITPDILLEVKKQEPVSDAEEVKVCRGAIGRPRRMLSDYESKEMVCPTCNKHFLGLSALQTHVSWCHCTGGSGTSSRLVSGLKRRALLSGDEVDRRLVCFVCKEIVPSASLLEAHIHAQHAKRLSSDMDPPKLTLSESAERLKSKMTLALGGLVDKALDRVLGSNKPAPALQSDLNTGALQLLGKICAAKKRVGSENIKLSPEMMQLLARLKQVSQKDEATHRLCNSALAHEMRAILSRGKPIGVSKGALTASVSSTSGSGTTPTTTVELKPTNLLDHLAVCSSDLQERPYACPICDLRFLIPSTRNRHIARAHGKYGRRYDEEADGDLNSQDDLDSGWKDSLDSCMDANDDGEMLPLCSDCGLSFQSIHEVMQHRIEDHPRRFSADGFQEDSKASLVLHNLPIVESSSETKQPQRCVKSEDVKSLPVSDNAIDSTSTIKKKRGRPAKSPDSTECRRKDSESEKTQTCNSSILCTSNDVKETSLTREECHSLEDDSDSLCDSNEGESNKESNSPESDKACERITNDFSSQNSSEETLAELARKLDRRKVRVGNMAEEAVRVKAEAALRELNLLRKSKSPSSAAKWGINAVKFTKQSSASVSTSEANGSQPKPRFTSLGDKKWKAPSSSTEALLTPKKEVLEDVKPDIYDFDDEDMDTSKRPFQQFKDSHQEPEHSGSNNSSSSSCYSPGTPKKANYSSKLNSDNS